MELLVKEVHFYHRTSVGTASMSYVAHWNCIFAGKVGILCKQALALVA